MSIFSTYSTGENRVTASLLAVCHSSGYDGTFNGAELLPDSSKSPLVRLLQVLFVAFSSGCAARGKTQSMPTTGEVAAISESSAESDANNQASVESYGHNEAGDIQGLQTSGDLTADSILMQVIGLPVSSAKLLAEQYAKGFRVVRIDGVQKPITADHNSGRLSVEVDMGVVVRAHYY